MRYITFIILAATLSVTVRAECNHDRERMLSLNLKSFDQDEGDGWRKIAKVEGCKPVAADIIREYRIKNSTKESILYWHEGQLRAELGENESAIFLFEKTRRPSDLNRIGWNFYLDASIAFLKKDKEKLLKSRNLLA